MAGVNITLFDGRLISRCLMALMMAVRFNSHHQLNTHTHTTPCTQCYTLHPYCSPWSLCYTHLACYLQAATVLGLPHSQRHTHRWRPLSKSCGQTTEMWCPHSTQVCVAVCVYVCLCACMSTCRCECVYVCVHANMRACVFVFVCVCLCTCVCV